MINSIFDVTSESELDSFDLGTYNIGNVVYPIITGYEHLGKRCRWCGIELTGRRTRYCCKEHQELYYHNFDWITARKHALDKAAYCCEYCGIKESDIEPIGSYMKSGLEVHHIVPVRGSKRWFNARNIEWNLTALCNKCHKDVHAGRIQLMILKSVRTER